MTVLVDCVKALIKAGHKTRTPNAIKWRSVSTHLPLHDADKNSMKNDPKLKQAFEDKAKMASLRGVKRKSRSMSTSAKPRRTDSDSDSDDDYK